MATSHNVRWILGAICLLAGCGGGAATGGNITGGGGGGGTGNTDTDPDTTPVVSQDVSPTSGVAPLSVTFDAGDSFDPMGEEPLSYEWDFGNGDISTGVNGNVIFDTPGLYSVRLTVTNAFGTPATEEVLVEVLDPNPPTATLAQEVLHLTNLERQTNGLPPLKGDQLLDAAALGHATDMAVNDYFDHIGLDGSAPWDRMSAAGYLWDRAGENIAAGHTAAADVVEAWMNSPGHRANILGADFVEVGNGYFFEGASTFGHYWVQNFGRSPGVFPVVVENEAFATPETQTELYIYGAGWAQEMRVSEDPNFAGVDWQPFQEILPWNLSNSSGIKTIYVELTDGVEVRNAVDQIVLE